MRRLATLVLMVGVACGATDDGDDDQGGDLPVGALDDADAKADGNWGSALTCKDIPALPALPSPQITVSIDGQTLRLFDRTTGFDKTFPIGVGGIEDDEASVAYGESRSMWPVLTYGKRARGYDNLVDVQGGFKALKESEKFKVTDYVCPSTLL